MRLQRNNVHAFQRPDADHVDVDPGAYDAVRAAGSLSFSKIAGEKTRFSANYGFKTPGFDMNDLGFQRRADERYVSHWFQMRDNVPGRFTRSFIWNLNQYAGWNFAGDRLWSGGNINMHWTWKNYYTTSFGFNVNGAPFRDRITRGGPGVLGNSNLSTWYTPGPTAAKSLSPPTTATTRTIARAPCAATSGRRSRGGRPRPRRSPPVSATTSTMTMRSG